MEAKRYKNNDTIFRQGDPSSCMYRIESGKVGIFLDYGGEKQTKLTELSAGQFLGEMGLMDRAPRSAAAVALCDDTVLRVINEENFNRFVSENGGEMLALLQQMSMRLRRISRDYADACRTVSDAVEAEKEGREKDPVLRNRIAKTLAGFEASRLEGRGEGGTEA